MANRALHLRAVAVKVAWKKLKKLSLCPIGYLQDTVIALLQEESLYFLRMEFQVTQMGLSIVYCIDPANEQLYRNLALPPGRTSISSKELIMRYGESDSSLLKKEISYILEAVYRAEPLGTVYTSFSDEDSENEATCWDEMREA